MRDLAHLLVPGAQVTDLTIAGIKAAGTLVHEMTHGYLNRMIPAGIDPTDPENHEFLPPLMQRAIKYYTGAPLKPNDRDEKVTIDGYSTMQEAGASNTQHRMVTYMRTALELEHILYDIKSGKLTDPREVDRRLGHWVSFYDTGMKQLVFGREVDGDIELYVANPISPEFKRFLDRMIGGDVGESLDRTPRLSNLKRQVEAARDNLPSNR